MTTTTLYNRFRLKHFGTVIKSFGNGNRGIIAIWGTKQTVPFTRANVVWPQYVKGEDAFLLHPSQFTPSEGSKVSLDVSDGRATKVLAWDEDGFEIALRPYRMVERCNSKGRRTERILNVAYQVKELPPRRLYDYGDVGSRTIERYNPILERWERDYEAENERKDVTEQEMLDYVFE